jgi:hypothetical protein
MTNRLAGNPAETIHRGESFVHRAPFGRKPPGTLELKRPPFCPWGLPLPVVSRREACFFCTVLGRARENHSCLRSRQLSAPTYLPRSPPTESTIEFSNPEKGSYLSTSCSGRTSTARTRNRYAILLEKSERAASRDGLRPFFRCSIR